MMGRQASGQDRLFYSFNLEEHVPANHLLRGIDGCLDLSGLHEHLAEHYSHTGRPSVDPELMLRMLRWTSPGRQRPIERYLARDLRQYRVSVVGAEGAGFRP